MGGVTWRGKFAAATVVGLRALRSRVRHGRRRPSASLAEEFHALVVRQGHPHPQPREVGDFWGDALRAYSYVFLGYCLIVGALVITGVTASAWPQALAPVLTFPAAVAGYMSYRVHRRGFGWRMRPTNGAYVAGLVGAVLMTLLLLTPLGA